MQPQWSVMDNFADVLSGVEYFLERYSNSPQHASSDLLTRVQRIIQNLMQLIDSDEPIIESPQQSSFESDPTAARYDDSTGIEEAEESARLNKEQAASEDTSEFVSADSVVPTETVELEAVQDTVDTIEPELPVETATEPVSTAQDRKSVV